MNLNKVLEEKLARNFVVILSLATLGAVLSVIEVMPSLLATHILLSIALTP